MNPEELKIWGKIKIDLEIKCETGLHIGASKENMEIGALDSPVVRDPMTKEPYIPGSSLKGKLRSLIEKMYGKDPNRPGGSGTRRHECDTGDDAAKCEVCRLFGSTGRNNGTNFPGKIKVRDFRLKKESRDQLQKIDTGLLYTEWKFENTLDRITAAANPRNLERVPRGAIFKGSMVYDLEKLDTAQQDLRNLLLAIDILKNYDALGGHGSRGYGQVNIVIPKVTAKPLVPYQQAEAGAEYQTENLTNLDQLGTMWQIFQVAEPQ